VTKSSRQFRKTSKTSRRLKQPLLELLPDLVKMRDSGRISPSECGAWSYDIGASGLAKKLRRDIESNPAIGPKAPKVPNNPPLPFTREEMIGILTALGFLMAVSAALELNGVRSANRVGMDG
jgi:hypothetical protein